MSSIVREHNTAIFGAQSPMYRIVSEPLVKERFLHLLIDKSATITRKKAWRIYQMMNGVFPNSTVEVNLNVKSAIGSLVNPIISTNLNNVSDSIMKTPIQTFQKGEIDLTNELIKATGVKNTFACVIENEKEDMTTCHGPIVYLTRSTVNGHCEPIELNWTNKFFTFNDVLNLSMFVVFPKQYLASVIMHTIAEEPKSINNISIDKLAMKGHVVDRITVDLIKAIFVAYYSDSLRSRVTSDILLVNKLLQKYGAAIDPSGHNNEEQFKDSIALLKQFKSDSNDEHLIWETMNFNTFGKDSMTINPLEFYTAFIDTPYVQIENVFDKIPAFARFNKSHYTSYKHSNNLSEMNQFMSDQARRDLIVFGIKIIRYLPWMLYSVYILGGGNYHNEVGTILSRVKMFLSPLMSFRAGNAYTAPLVKFICDNIDYLSNDFYKQISSPVTVTSSSKRALTIAIDKFGFRNEEENGVEA